MNYFSYNGKTHPALRVKSKSIFSVPKLDVTMTSVPGRNGELITPGGRFPNATVTYTCFVVARSQAELSAVLTEIKNWLYAEPDRYHELTDTYDTLHTRQAVISGKLDITEQFLKVGSFTVTFSAKPFKYLRTGLDAQTYTQNFSLTNPYAFAAKPYLKLNGRGEGELLIQSEGSNKVWKFKTLNGYTECDAELMNYYHDTELKNDTVEGDGFPELPAGTCSISFSGGITSVEIIPRWCTL